MSGLMFQGKWYACGKIKDFPCPAALDKCQCRLDSEARERRGLIQIIVAALMMMAVLLFLWWR